MDLLKKIAAVIGGFVVAAGVTVIVTRAATYMYLAWTGQSDFPYTSFADEAIELLSIAATVTLLLLTTKRFRYFRRGVWSYAAVTVAILVFFAVTILRTMTQFSDLFGMCEDIPNEVKTSADVTLDESRQALSDLLIENGMGAYGKSVEWTTECDVRVVYACGEAVYDVDFRMPLSGTVEENEPEWPNTLQVVGEGLTSQHSGERRAELNIHSLGKDAEIDPDKAVQLLGAVSADCGSEFGVEYVPGTLNSRFETD